MRRREFLATTLAAGLALSVGEAGAEKTMDKTTAHEYYELRRYTFAEAAVQTRFEGYLREAFLPAAKHLGNGPVGVFVPREPTAGEPLSVYLLIPHASIEAFADFSERLAADKTYKIAGASVLDLPSSDPPYLRLESWLMLAFAGYPKLHVPKETATNAGRTFELRIYESHSKKANKKKIEMFNSGEIGIFERGGFQPVFFGETILGSGMPNLTYMITYADGTERSVYWERFKADPETKRLFAIPEYADKEIVSKIRAVMLRPTAFSQI